MKFYNFSSLHCSRNWIHEKKIVTATNFTSWWTCNTFWQSSDNPIVSMWNLTFKTMSWQVNTWYLTRVLKMEEIIRAKRAIFFFCNFSSTFADLIKWQLILCTVMYQTVSTFIVFQTIFIVPSTTIFDLFLSFYLWIFQF